MGHVKRLSRRAFGLGALGAPLGALALGAAERSARRLLVVHAEGGWDPLAVFAPMFDAPNIQMEEGAAPLTVGSFTLVDGPERPSVAEFFRTWGDRTLLINGLSTRSVNHEVCQAVALTGTPSDGSADWGTLLALGAGDRYYLPHLVLSGPAFPGGHTTVVAHARGRVREAVEGSVSEIADPSVPRASDEASAIVDGYLASRVATEARRPGAGDLGTAYEVAEERSRQLVSVRDLVKFPRAESVRAASDVAIQALADGLCRVATVGTDFVWDTHGDNAPQALLFEELFSDLSHILAGLESSVTADGALLADITDVLVISEMGRTPAFNATGGRDHWPFTSALVIGTGIRGGRAIGGYTSGYTGIGVDPASGDLDPDRPGIDARAFGATLLALGGVDPAEHMTSPEIIEGVLA